MSVSKPLTPGNYFVVFENSTSNSINEIKDWVPVKNVKQLEKKCVMRTKSPSHIWDYSFTSDPIFITKITPSGHILYKSKYISDEHILNPHWNDDKWIK